MSASRPELILASGSPRRVEIINRLDLPFTVRVSGVDESVDDESDPAGMVIALAERKARAVAADFGSGLVIGADTTVVIDAMVLNKPLDDDDARRMLRLLRGRDHAVWTGVAVVDASTGDYRAAAVRSLVRMRSYSDDDIDSYVATGEPLDKAGAYAIQGGAGIFVQGIEGCYLNVVGLPLCELTRLLADFGSRPGPNYAPCTLANGRPCARSEMTTLD